MRSAATLVVATCVAIASAGSPAQAQVYEFTADYCGACRTVAPLIAQLVSQGYPIEPIDVQARPALARQYGVDQIPSFVAVRDGQVVGRVVGATGREELVKLCQLTQTGSRLSASSRESGGHVPATANAAVVSPLASSSATAAVVPQPSDPVATAKAATVRLRIEDDAGHSFGTGTIIDVHDGEALVLTCGHIFRASKGQGRVMCELFCPNAPPAIEGKLVCYDMRRDVGLVSVNPGVPIQAVSIGGTGQRPQQGDPVFSLGCDRGNDPSVIRNQILAVNRYHGPANLVVGGRPMDGRSGGGLFSSEGVLIGVCNAADQEQDEGLYAALGPIHAELDRAGLGFIYRNQQPALARAQGQSDRPVDIARQSTPSPSLPSPMPPALATLEPASTTASTSKNLIPPNDSVQAVAASAGGDAELICIVRDTDDAEGRSRVFVINRPSSNLVHHLSKEANRRGPHAPTQMHQARNPQAAADVSANGWRSLATQN